MNSECQNSGWSAESVIGDVISQWNELYNQDPENHAPVDENEIAVLRVCLEALSRNGCKIPYVGITCYAKCSLYINNLTFTQVNPNVGTNLWTIILLSGSQTFDMTDDTQVKNAIHVIETKTFFDINP